MIEMAQFAPAASDEPQVLDCVKSEGFAPAIAMLVIASDAVPVLLKVAVWATLVVPDVAVKVSEPGTRVTTGATGVVPVPVTAKVAGVATFPNEAPAKGTLMLAL